MRQYLRISSIAYRSQTCVLIFAVVFSCVIRSGQQEVEDPHSFTTLLQVLEDDDIREKRAVEQDDVLDDGSGVSPSGKDLPVIVESEVKKFVFKKVSKVSVDVGSTVWAVRGTEITVSCRASSNFDTPKILWYRNGVVMTDRFRGSVAAIDGILRIRRLTRFNEDTYTCKASNTAGERRALFTAKLFDPSLPTIITAEGDVSFGPNDKEAEITIGSDVTVYQGARLTIRCPADATVPVVVYWTAQGRSAEIGKAVKVGQDLVITDIDQRYALEYECNARSSRGKAQATSTVSVIALNPPKIQAGTKDIRVIDEKNKDVEIHVGTKLTVISETQVTVRCVSAMEPSPAISWKIRGKKPGLKNGVTISEDNSTLTISYPGVEDSGDYMCTASNNVGQDSKSSKINILPPEPPTIRYSDRKITSLGPSEVIEATIGDELILLAGASILITCPTSGLPTPTVQWKKDDKDLAEFGRTLKINNVTKMDTGTFTCEAMNRAGRISRTSKLTVIASEKPQIEKSTGRVTGIAIEEAVVKIGQYLRVVEGLIVRVVCQVRGFPTPEVSWFLNERMLKTSGRFLIDSRSSSLIVNGIQAQDAGEVSCLAENSAGKDTASTFVSIIGKSGAEIQSGNNSVKSIEGQGEVSIQIGDSLQVLSGSDVSIDCLASGTPSPVINWRWNERQVSSTGRFVIKEIAGGSRLIARKLTLGSAGQYQCTAFNVDGSDRVTSTVTVIEALVPKIEVSSTSVKQIVDLSLVSVIIGTRVTILPGAPLVITCRAFAIPKPTISWLRKGKKITSSERFSINSTTLVIHRTQRDDSGSFTCLAQNTIGKDSASSMLDFIEPISPRITQTGKDLKIEQFVRLSEAVGGNILCRDGIYLELTCSVEGLPTPKVTWLRGSTKIGTGRKLSLGILQEESSGNYTCLAANIAGDTRKTTRLTVRSSIPPVIQSDKKVLKSFEEGMYLTVNIGTRLQVIQGTRIDLICRVTGFPTPRVNWVKGNVRLEQRFEGQGLFIVPYDGTVSTLRIRGSQPAQEDEVYGCTAYNAGGSVTAFSYVTFYERVPPSIKSTWVTGSVGIKVSLESRDPIKLVIGDSLQAFTKTKVTIECPVFAIPLADVKWTKDGGSLPSKHKVNGTNLVLSEDSGTSDSGRYLCAATNPLGRDASYSVITLIEPTAPSIITSELSLELSNAVNYRATIGTNITTVLGNNITFVCIAEGLPSPTVTWWKGDLDLNSTQTSLVVTAGDTNATGAYSCKAANLAGSITTSSVVAVLDRIAPERATVPRIITTRENQEEFGDQRTVEHLVGGNVTILEGRNLLLRCPAEGLPQPSTSWLFNGIPVVVSDTLQFDQDTGDLKIIEMSQEDVGEYSCVATNIAGEAVETSYATVIEPTFPKIDSSNISIEVFDPTRQPITVKIGSKVTTLTGTPVIITCDVSGFPDPKVAWVKGYNPVTSSNTERLFLSENRISLLSSGVSDSGLYMCTASSPGGQAAAVSNITFVESVKPRILFATRERELLDRVSLKVLIGEKLTVLDKSNITIECAATGAPTPMLSWSKDNIKLENSQSSLLLLSNVELKDAGRYTCTAENFLGFVSYSTVLSVRGGEKPSIRSKSHVVLVDDRITAITLDVGSNLTLVAGSTVTVLCEVQGEPTPAIKWYQNGNHISSNVNKTSLSVGDPVRVNLQTVTCTGDNILGTASKSSYFTILEPSKPQIMVNEEKKVIEAQNRSSQVLIIGDDLIALTKTNITISCPTSGVPRPSITWTKDGRILRNDGRYQVQRDGSLVFHEADERDGARYTCNAVGVDGQDSASSILQVVEPAKPLIQVPKRGQELPIDDVSLITMNIGDNVTAALNTTITIRCPVSGVPTPTVTWQRDGVNIIGDDLISIVDDNSLIMKQPMVQDSGNYTCTAESEFGKDEVFSSVRIIELVRPKIDIAHTPQMIEAQDRGPLILNIGDNATALTKTAIVVLCHASGVPTPTVTWTKDGQKLSHDEGSSKIVNNDGSLRIVYSTEFDSGEYRCTATNIVGEEAMKSTVRIVEPRRPVIDVPKTGEDIPVGDGSPVMMNVGDNVTAPSNTTVTIRCPVSGVPTPSVTWKKNGVEIEERRKTNIAANNSLVFQSAEVQDSAKYTCTAQNKFGKDVVSSVVGIVGHSKPVISVSVTQKAIEAQDRSPITLTIGDNATALTDSSVTLLCHVSGVPKPIVTWTKFGQTIATGGRYTVQDNGELLIDGAREEDEAQYKCTAVNVAGQDSESSYIRVVEPKKPKIEVPQIGREIPVGDGSPVFMNVGDNVTIASNTTITIRCPVSGIPKATVTWQRDGSHVAEGDRYSIKDDKSLVIEGEWVEERAKYTCIVQSKFGMDETSSYVMIIELSKPVIAIPGEPRAVEVKDQRPVIINIGYNLTALTNTSITIQCHASGVPKPNITWAKDGQKLSGSGRYTVQDDGSLLINKSDKQEAARYICTANNVAGEDSTVSTVQIIEPKKPMIAVSGTGRVIPVGDGSPVIMDVGDNVTAVSNTTITIRCPISGVPTPTVTWRKDNVPIVEEAFSITSDYRLVLNGLEAGHIAKYTCIAQSEFGTDETSSVVQILERSQPVIRIPSKPKMVEVKDRSPILLEIGNNVTALTNTSIIIKCHVNGVPTPTVTWTKDGLRITSNEIYMLLADYSLRIRELYEIGTARYTCSAKSVIGKVSASSTVLIVEPSKPKIEVLEVGKNIPIGDGSPVTMNVGDNLTAASNITITIRCPVSGVPTPAVIWLKEGAPIIEGRDVSTTDDKSLVITRADSDDNGRYSCTAVNVAGMDNSSSDITIIGPSKPKVRIPAKPVTVELQDQKPFVIRIGDNVTALTNTSITIQCHASGVPTPTVTWTKDGQKISSGDIYTIGTDNSMLIKDTKDVGRARYTCTAVSVIGEDSASSTVQVVGLSKPKVDVPAKTQTIEAHDRNPITLGVGNNVTALTNTRITIECRASGVPKPTVVWSNDNQKMNSNDGNKIQQEDGSLLIRVFKKGETVRYTCTATNVAGQDSASSTVEVVEPVKPVIIVPETGKVIPVGDGSPVTIKVGDNVTAASYTNITIRCPISGVPTPKVNWLKDDVPIVEGEAFSITSDYHLVLKGLEAEHIAKYTCMAKSEFGTDEISSIVQIIERSHPVIRIPSELKMIEVRDRSPIFLEIGNNVTALTNTTITIKCRAEGVPTPTVTWTKDGLRITSSEIYTIQADDSLRIRELYEIGTARYTCTAKSLTGEVSASSTVLLVEPSKPIIEVLEAGQNIPIGDGSPVTMNVGDNLTAASNTSITIRCPVSGVPTPAVTWLKEGAPIIEGRDVFTTDNKSLVIARAEAEDIGRYTCRIVNVAGMDNSSSEITIIGPSKPKVKIPAKPTTVELQNQKPVTIRIGNNVTALTNTSITIQCHASGVPTPTATWTKDGQKISNGDIYTIGTDNSLLIKNTKEKSRTRYTCTAVSVIGKDSASSTVQIVGLSKPKVDVPAKPHTIDALDRNPITLGVGNNVTALINTRITIRCRASGVPTPTVTWSTENRKILSEEGGYIVQEDGSLLVKVADKVDTVRYTCTAVNFAGQDSASSSVVVVEPVKPMITVPETGQVIPVGDGSPVTIKVGDNVTLASNTTITIKCPVSGVPTPTITWEKNGLEVISGDKLLITHNNSLVIKETGVDDSAKYTCRVKSEFGIDESSSSIRILEPIKPQINIRGDPKSVEAKDRNPITVNIGDNVTALTNTRIVIRCDASGVPTPSITWTKDGQTIFSDQQYKVMDNGSLLIIKKVKESANRYTCTAISASGQDSASSMVEIFVPTKPVFDVPEIGREIPMGDGSPVMINVGDNVTAASNTTITIRCPVSGIPTPTVTWEKNGVLLFSEKNISVEKVNSLVIRGTEAEDSGKYTCRVLSVAGMNKLSSVVTIVGHSKPKIKISDVPKTAESHDRKPLTIIIGNNVTVLTDTNITIQCNASGAPTPTVTWTIDSHSISSGEKYKIQDDGSLLISKTSQKYIARYNCIAESVAGKDSASSTVRIVEPTKPVINVPDVGRDILMGDGSLVKMNVGDNVTAASNTTITIRCPVSGVPKPSVTWQRNGIQITEGSRFSIGYDNTLVIKGAISQDSSKYTCTVQSEFGKDNTSSTVLIIAQSKPTINISDVSETIEAQDSSPVTITIGDNVTALANTNITIQCQASGAPKPSVTWSKDNKKLSSGDRYTVQVDGSLLLIIGTRIEDSARYTCTAESVAGTDSASSKVQVVEPRKPIVEVSGTGKEIPVGDGSPVTMNIGDNVTAASNTTITIRCPVSGVPTPAVTWEKEGLTLTSEENIFIVNESLLIIRESKEENSGRYICKVKNGFGEESLSSIVRILGPSKPKIRTPTTPKTIETQDRKPITIVIGDNVTALTNTNIAIQCHASGVPAPTVTWSKDGKVVNSKGSYTVKDDGLLVINGAAHEDSTRYTCTVDNAAGTDSASSTVRIVDPIKPGIEINKTSQEIPVGDGTPVIIKVGDNVTVASNTTITIRCPVSGVPPPTVTWEKDGVLILEGGRFTFMPFNNSLVVRRATKADIATYTCRVQNFFGTHKLSSTVNIIDPVSPQITYSLGDVAWFSEKPVNITIGQHLVTLVDTVLSIHCAAKGIPIPKVTWARGNQSLPSDGRMNVKNGTLLIVKLETSDSGNYTCSAQNSAGIASESSIVTVAVPTPPEITQTGIKDLQVLEPKSEKAVVGSTVLTISGNNLSLTCDVTGFPPPSIEWAKDGTVLGADGSVLRLLSVDVDDTSVYTCTATSPLGQVDSQSTNLTVIALQVPKITINDANVELLKMTNVSVTIGGKVTTLDRNKVSIVCQVTGVPSPEITWERDEVELQKGGVFYTIESVTSKDSGRYTCVAKNVGGEVKATTQLQVLAGKAPTIDSLNRSLVHLRIDFYAITIGTNLTTLASSGLEIICPASGFPKPSIQWFREGDPVEPGMMLNVDEETGTLFTLSISHRKGGRFSCKASNALGSVYASSFIAVLVPGAPQINVSRVPVQSLDSRDPAFITIGQTLSVLNGTNLSITCPVSGIPEPVVTWSRQNKDLDTNGRVVIKDSVLTILRVTNTDTGIYLCKAVNLAGDVTANSNVTVLETSTPLISRVSQPLQILNSGSFTVDVGSIVTTVAGNGLFLRCNTKGVPTPKIIWSKDSIPLNVEGSLYILKSLSASDSGSYQCVASNIDGADKEDIQIVVLDGNAPKITSSGENIIAISGEKQLQITIGDNLTTVIGTDIDILCPVAALPNPTITWLFNGSAIKEGNPRLVKVAKTVLNLAGVTPEDIGSYTCHANNTFGKDIKTTFLSLIIPVEPKIMSSNKDLRDFKSVSHRLVIGDDLDAVEGSTVYISCPTTGNPVPEIHWKTPGGLISSSERLRILNNTLGILDGTWSDSGIYSCIATNGAGSDEMATRVNFMAPKKPSIRGDPIDIESFDRQPVTVAVGGTVKVLEKTTVNIQCVASGIPEPSVSWNSSSNDMQPANKFDVNQGGQLLTIRDVDPTDSGTYLCSAVNKAGEDSRAAVLEVIEPSLPKIVTSDTSVSWYNRKHRILPVGGRVEVLSGTKVTLTCDYSAFPEANVKWIVLDVEGDPLPDVGYEVINGSLVLMALRPSDSAQYVCSVENVAGTASASTILKVVDPQPPSISSSQESIISLSDRLPVQAITGNVVTVLSGTSITVTCSADGLPTPSLAWSREEQLIPTTQSGILRVENSTAEDSGDYLCTAMSEVGVDQESTKITVIEPREPRIRPPEGDRIPLTNATLVKVTVGSEVTVLTQSQINITCVVSGIPKPNITWLRDGEQLEAEEGSFLVLNIQDVNDAGRITCQAENMAGKAALSTIINIIEPAIPRITSDTGTIDALNKRRAVTGSVGVTVKMFTATSLTLRCYTEGSPEPTVSWSKNGQQLDSKGRISISDDGAMTITNTRTHDTGRYRCLAKNIIGKASVASSVYVRAPMAPTIRKSDAYIIWYESQPFKAKIGDNLTTLKGRRLTLTCPAVGVPKPAVSWYRGGMKMRSGKNYLVIGQTLIMYRLDPMDTDRYTCVARNFAGVKTATSTLKVHEPMAPDIMSSYGSAESLQDWTHFNFTIGTDVAILQGSPMTIKCPVIGVPEPKIGWIKDGKMLTSNDRMDMDCVGTLNIYKLELEDSGDYVCTAQSFLGMDIAFSAVTVIEAVKPTVDISNRAYISSGELIDMQVGDNLTAILTTPVNINCTASGVPKPSMTWEMNGKQLGNGGNYNTDNNGALIIRGVQDPGEFTCVAQNFVGQDGASSFIALLDPRKPMIKSSDEPKTIESMDQNPLAMIVGDNVTALTNTSVTVQCNASGVPPPIITWTHDGRKISSGDRYAIQNSGSLFIREPDKSDTAQYTCTAENVVGKVSASSIVQIVEPVKPVIEVQRPGRVIPVGDGSPVTIDVGDNVTAPSNTTITIRCPVSGIPKPVISWERDGVQVTPEGRLSISSDNSLVIKEAGVDEGANYKCSVQSIAGTDSVSSTVSIVELSKPVVKIPDKPKTSEAQNKSLIIMNIGDNMTALTDTNITIQCHASGVPKPTVTWLKNGQKIHIDSKYAVQDDGSLIIRGTDKGDTARYSCIAESATGKDSASSVVMVAEPKKPVVAVSETGQKIPIGDGSPVTMNVGDNVTAASNTTITIRCPVNGVPTPTVTWEKNGVEIIPGDDIMITRDNTLVIVAATSEDNAQYICRARGLTGTDSASSTIEIIEPSRPTIEIPDQPKTIESTDQSPIVTTIGDNVTAVINTSVTIRCNASGVPIPTVTWTKDGKKIVKEDRYSIQDDSSLLIKDSNKEDTARYTCTVESVAGKESASSTVQIIDLKGPLILVPKPGPKISIGNGYPVITTIGSQITEIALVKISLTCPTQGSPPPNITWKKDGKELVSGNGYVIDNKGTLTILEALTEDSGRYSCLAQNVAGKEEVTSPIDILEPAEPIILPSQGTDISDDHNQITTGVGTKIDTINGTTVVIACNVKGVPKPTVSWSKDSQSISSHDGVTFASNGTLIIRVSKAEDSGNYTCTASSRSGIDSATSPVTVSITRKPSIERSDRDVFWESYSPLKVTVGNKVEIIDGSSVTLVCKSSGIPLPSLRWTRGIETSSVYEKYDIEEETLTISNIQIGDADNFTCTATNMAGQDTVTTELIVLEHREPVILSNKVNLVDVNNSKPVVIPIGANMTTVINATIIMKCVTEGSPTPTVSWNHNGRLITTGDRHQVNHTALMIENVQLGDAGRYDCTATNRFGRDDESLLLTITVPPLISNVKGSFEITDIRQLISITTGAVVTIPRGVSVRIKCLATGIPQPDITWYKRDQNHKERTLVVPNAHLKILKDNSLSIKHTLVVHAAFYTCVATNIAGQDEGTTHLNIGTPPEIPSYWQGMKSRFNDRARHLKAAGASATIVKGATLNIRCAAVGTPKPTIKWIVATSGRQSRYTVLHDGTLEVPNAELMDEGNYTCIANNSYGTLNRTTTVSILVPPQILERHFRHLYDKKGIEGYAMAHMEVKRRKVSSLTVKQGYNLVLICTVSGKPKPHVTWTRNRVLIKNDTRHLLLPNGVLLVRRILVKESGQYKCVATNVVGKDQGTVQLTVRDQGKGYWEASEWSQCGNCVSHRRGWQERHISCIGPGNAVANDLHCIHKPKPIKRRKCTHKDCEVMWRASAWSACSRTCGLHGIKLRNVQCVFVKSLNLATGQCHWQEKPSLQEPCNRKSCTKANCVDKVKYCEKVKIMRMCPVYSRWCCNTCHS